MRKINEYITSFATKISGRIEITNNFVNLQLKPRSFKIITDCYTLGNRIFRLILDMLTKIWKVSQKLLKQVDVEMDPPIFTMKSVTNEKTSLNKPESKKQKQTST